MAESRPGKTAPRLLQDLLTYDPRYEQRAGRNLLIDAPPHFNPEDAPRPAVPVRNCRHTLMRKDEQTHLPGHYEEFDQAATYNVASYCSKCRWHFDVTVAFSTEHSKNMPCRSWIPDYPLHHFQFAREESEFDAVVRGIQLHSRTFVFLCSADQCPVGLRIRVTPPRITDADIVLLTDGAVLRQRWEKAREIAGDQRAEDKPARRFDAIDYLNTYLQDCLNPVKGKSRIPLLNRKFLKAFGKDCDGILKKLGFTADVDLDDEGNSSEVWHLPQPSAARYPTDLPEPTPTWRCLIEDARYELNLVLLTFSNEDRKVMRRPPTALTPSVGDIEKILNCDNYEKAPGRTTSNANHEEDHPYYAGLGTVGDFSDHNIIFAHRRQVAVDRNNAPYYFEALQNIAAGRNSDALNTEYGLLASQGYTSRKEVNAAYRYFGISLEHAPALSDDFIISQYRSRLQDISPSMVEETRAYLRIIGHARDSGAIARAASDTVETYEQAMSWLGLEEDAADEFVRTMYTIKTNDSPGNRDTARRAVSIIAEHRNSLRLRSFLEKGDMAEPDMDVASAYLLLGIDDRAAKLDDQVLGSSVEMLTQMSPENAAKYAEALTLVRNDQKSHTGNNEPALPQHPPATWPVGCSNIGNTCYLNSVLQFLFTIKPLREMVLDCENHMQDLNPEALAAKRVGRATTSPERVETGQLFVRELRKLFQQMITEPTSTVRPERSLAILALEKNDAPTEEVAETSTTPADTGFIGPMPQPQPEPEVKPLLGSRPPTPADSAMGDCDETKSDNSSMKAMDLSDSAVIETRPEPPSRPPPIPPRPQPVVPLVTADTKFRKAEEVAKQQDAAESINNLFDLISCAIKGDGVLREDEQDDIIKKLFFADITTVRTSNGKETSKSDLQDTLAVTPNDRDRKLCAALDDEFGLSETEPGVTKYEFFERSPPIQIFNARRLQYKKETQKSFKEESHLALDPIMYMDRYMKETKSLSREELQKLRKQQWSLQAELRDLEDRRKTLKQTEFKANGNSVSLPAVLEETAAFAESINKDTPDASSDIEMSTDDLPGQLRKRAEDLRPQIEELDDRMNKLEKEIDSVFSHCQDHPYRLHSVFMHSGSATGGHYWIYIYDFQNKIWRKYNDEYVQEEKEEKILSKNEGFHPATSTGIVYVRDDVVLTHTEAVCRMIGEVEGNGSEPKALDTEMKDADVDAGEFEDLPVINGVGVEGANGEAAHGMQG